MLESFIQSETMDDMQKRVMTFQGGCAAVKELTDAARIAAVSLKGHVQGLQREEKRKKQKAAKLEEEQALKKARQDNKHLAALVKTAQSQKPSLFLIDWGSLVCEKGEKWCTGVATHVGPGKASIQIHCQH